MRNRIDVKSSSEAKSKVESLFGIKSPRLPVLIPQDTEHAGIIAQNSETRRAFLKAELTKAEAIIASRQMYLTH